jgi:hypothetical protein
MERLELARKPLGVFLHCRAVPEFPTTAVFLENQAGGKIRGPTQFGVTAEELLQQATPTLSVKVFQVGLEQLVQDGQGVRSARGR